MASVSTAPAPAPAKCAPKQIEEMKTLARIFIEMFLRLPPEQQQLYSVLQS